MAMIQKGLNWIKTEQKNHRNTDKIEDAHLCWLEGSLLEFTARQLPNVSSMT